MRKLLLLAGAACMGLAAAAAADPGGKGGGKGGGKPEAAKVDRGGGKGGGKQAKAERRGPKVERRADAGPRQERKVERQAQRAAKPERAERRASRDDKRKDFRQAERRGRDLRDEQRRVERVYRERDDRRFVDLRDLRDGDRRYVNLDAACPPGLAKKRNGCLPPGQAKKLFSVGDRIQPAWFSGYDLPVRYRAFYRDTPDHYFRYDDDGYIYRIDAERDLISSIIPLFGGGFAVGQPLPMGYDIYNVPYSYRDVYYDTDDYHYRYGDNAIYQVDAQSGLIEGIVSLLAGDLAVGQTLPAGYDAYNVPLDYRDRYYDTDEHLYRYADNSIYQVDPETMLIEAIVEMLI